MQAEQGSEEWHKLRLGVATASRFSDVLAKTRNGYSTSRKNYMSELVMERLTGQTADSYKSSAMEWGTETEPVARLEYTLQTGNDVDETGFWKHKEIEAGASPDGLIGDDGLLEIKSPNTATHLETLKSGVVPQQYTTQVQGQLWITGRKWCDFVSYDPRLPENAQLFIKRVERDDDFIAVLDKEVREFLREVGEETEFVKNYRGQYEQV